MPTFPLRPAIVVAIACFAAAMPVATSAAPRLPGVNASPGPGLGPVRLKEQLLNQQVKNDKGENLGLIEDLMVDSQGRLLYAVLAPSGDVRMSDKYLLVPWPALSKTTEDNLMLPLDKERLAQAPAYSKNQPPNIENVQFNTTTYAFYRLGYTAPKTEFVQLDMDDDGTISVSEAEQQALLSAHFAAADRNRNGNIDRAEFSAFEQRIKPAPNTPAP